MIYLYVTFYIIKCAFRLIVLFQKIFFVLFCFIGFFELLLFGFDVTESYCAGLEIFVVLSIDFKNSGTLCCLSLWIYVFDILEILIFC